MNEAEYVYSATFFIRPDVIDDFIDLSDIGMSLDVLNFGEYLGIRSSLFGDKYSARNWLYTQIRDALLRGIKDEDFVVAQGSFATVYSHPVSEEEKPGLIGSLPGDDDQRFFQGGSDMEFSLRFGKDFFSKRDRLLKYELLLDSNVGKGTEIRGGSDAGSIRGPEIPPFKIQESEVLEQIELNTNNLLKECVDFKEWTIPPNTIVDLRSESYRYVEVIEEKNMVAFIFRDASDYFTLGYDVTEGKWIDDYVVLDGTGIDSEEVKRHCIAVKYLAALILHDFWVTEYRERNKYWNPKKPMHEKGRLPWAKSSQDGRLLIYMPRTRYFEANDTREESEQIFDDEEVKLVKNGVFQERTHNRAAHVRNLNNVLNKNPKPEQILLADAYNIRVPKGYTFVRPSEGNNLVKQNIILNRIYASRSALKCLTNIEEFYPNQSVRVKWQEFEDDVRSYIKKVLGYTIIPREIKRRGDGGLDILALKKKSNSYHYLMVQCKCWSKNRVVGVPIVRELVASLKLNQEVPEGSKISRSGLIVTTSRFSTDPEFVRICQEEKIFLLDGESFAKKELPEEW